MNYFHLLNLPTEYNIDQHQLTKNYYDLQGKYHPDAVISAEKKKKNLLISMEINRAYNILKNDINRAEHLLELQNINLKEVELKKRFAKHDLDMIWEEQDILEKTNDILELEKFYQHKTLDKKNLINRLTENFANNKFYDALDIVIMLKYLVKLIDNIKHKIRYADR